MCPDGKKLTSYQVFIQDHLERCINKKVACPNGCGEMVTVETKDSHVDVECEAVLMECEQCGGTAARSELAKHYETCT